MDLGWDKTNSMSPSKAGGRTRPRVPMPSVAKYALYALTKCLPERTKACYFFRSMPRTQKRDLNRLGIPAQAIRSYTAELRLDTKFCSDLFARIASAQEVEPRLGGIPPMHTLEFIYAMVRHCQPEILVETGVAAGGISSVILKALHANDKGKLYSIDLPGFDRQFYPSIGKAYHIHVPDGWEPGWLVPPELKSGWALVLGDVRAELPGLLAKLGNIDFFLHDSLHTYEHMMFEYSLAYMYSSHGAYLVSHDVMPYWSLAFIDFCHAKGLEFALVDGILGIANIKK